MLQVISEIDFHTEKELQENFDNEEKQNELNRDREILIKEVKECEKFNLNHLNNEFQNLNYLDQEDEDFTSKIFISFCFVLIYKEKPLLIVTDTCLPKKSLDLFLNLFCRLFVDGNVFYTEITDQSELEGYFEISSSNEEVTTTFSNSN
jgi:hypothetical protein